MRQESPTGSAAVPESATSLALTSLDIFTEIVEQTALPSDGALYPEYDCESLSTLALVCRAFNGPANKALWSRLDSFFPLLSLFSAFDDERTGLNGATTPTYMISGDILPHELSRFLELGSLVRAVIPLSSYCVCELDLVNTDVWLYLAQICGGKSLFPHLQELHWTIQETSGTELLFILSSSLRRLTVCYGGCSTDSREWMLSQSMLFRTVFNITPHLTHFVIRHTHEALFLPCISNLSILRMVRVVWLDQDETANVDVLRALSFIESLEELSIAVGDIVGVDFCGFPALKNLNVSILSGSQHLILGAFSSPRLRELHVLNETYGNFLDMEELFTMSTTLARRFPAMTNLDLSLCLSVREGSTASLANALAPLFPLPLTKFSFYSQSALASPGLTDDFFSTLAQSWAHLLELSIIIPRASDDDSLLSGTTAQSLLSLARGCPLLRTLRLPSMKSPQREEISGYAVLQHPLRMLNVNWLAVGSPATRPGDEEPYRACALLLDKLFPELETEGELCGATPTEVWRRVMYGVQMCQLGRSNRTSA